MQILILGIVNMTNRWQTNEAFLSHFFFYWETTPDFGYFPDDKYDHKVKWYRCHDINIGSLDYVVRMPGWGYLWLSVRLKKYMNR